MKEIQKDKDTFQATYKTQVLSLINGYSTKNNIDDPAGKRLEDLILSERIEDLNSLRKALDINLFLLNIPEYLNLIELKNISTPILTSENALVKFFEEKDIDGKYCIEGTKKISLICANLTSLPHHIVRFCNLKTIDLSFNKITSFPEVLLQMKKLQEIDLCHNFISFLPEKVWEVIISGTQKINLDFNPLEFYLTEIQETILKNHGVLKSPKEFQELFEQEFEES